MARNARAPTRNPVRDRPHMRMGKREPIESEQNLIKIGEASHPIKDSLLLVIKLTENTIPYFSAGIYGEGNRRIASVHEIFGKLDEEAYCCIKIEDRLSPESFAKGSIFRADRFKCLTFERVKGASQVSGIQEKKNSKVPQPFKKGPSSKYRTNAQNQRVAEYAKNDVRKNMKEYKHRKTEFISKTMEKRKNHFNKKSRITFTD
ncbi:H/ACA ribonucleoprotein complex subunit 1 [Nematocida sp. LUAm3]|nr:H/ACA ribonucleoprotein complex subunit 1 [Nematocida sp. LUAm3]KAI5174853.1 H/ACA ribonucleoprotein complex subunit 1 [Nematocida sp. LUAm2]KAI5177549.1 H/ACA ribonucleoprotein complex subunit 1 [Nematocida sp. LUAm1]